MTRILLGIICALLLAGCGSGGGEGGGSSGGRTTGTGLRVIHGSLDEAPITVRLPDREVQSARFAEATGYTSIPFGALNLTVHRANAPNEVLEELTLDAQKDTEYTVFLIGVSRFDTQQVVLVTDRVLRPEVGRSYVRFMNSFQSRAALELLVGDQSLGKFPLGGVSDFLEVPSGTVQFRVRRDSGVEIASFSTVLPDRSEATVVASGSETPFFIATPVYIDLD